MLIDLTTFNIGFFIERTAFQLLPLDPENAIDKLLFQRGDRKQDTAIIPIVPGQLTDMLFKP